MRFSNDLPVAGRVPCESAYPAARGVLLLCFCTTNEIYEHLRCLMTKRTIKQSPILLCLHITGQNIQGDSTALRTTLPLQSFRRGVATELARSSTRMNDLYYASRIV